MRSTGAAGKLRHGTEDGAVAWSARAAGFRTVQEVEQLKEATALSSRSAAAKGRAGHARFFSRAVT